MTIFGSSQRVSPGNPGMRLFQSAGVVLPWWNPDGATPGGVGGSCVGAYQAKSAVSYAVSKVNLANPGTNDLVEGNGAVPWAGGTGWGFVAAALQWLDTGLIPANDQSWSMLVQYANVTNTGILAGSFGAAPRYYFFVWPDDGGGRRRYANDQFVQIAGTHLVGNLGVAGAQGYRDGIADGAAMGVGGTGANSVFVGAYNANGVTAVYITAAIESIAIYDVTLTAPQVAAREARMVIL